MKPYQVIALLVILGVLSYAGMVWKSCQSMAAAREISTNEAVPASSAKPVASAPAVNDRLYSELEGYRLSGNAPDEQKMFMWLLVSEPNAPRHDVEGISVGDQKNIIVRAYKHEGLRLPEGQTKADQFKLHSFAHSGGQNSSYSRQY